MEEGEARTLLDQVMLDTAGAEMQVFNKNETSISLQADSQADVYNRWTIDFGELAPETLQYLNKVGSNRDHLVGINFSYFDKVESAGIPKHSRFRPFKALGGHRASMSVARYKSSLDQLEYHHETLRCLKAHSTSNIEKDCSANREFVLPLYSKSSQEEKSLTWKDFMRYGRKSVLNIPPKYHGALLILCGSFLGYQTKNTTAPFDFGFKNSNNAPPQSLLLTFGEAFKAFFPEMTHITKFILCYFLTLVLVYPLQAGVQIFCMLLLISAPLFYFPELVRKASASGVDVACGGSFKLPLIGFATLGAVGFSLICGLATMLIVYLSWRFLYKGKSRVKEIEVSLDGLSQILG